MHRDGRISHILKNGIVDGEINGVDGDGEIDCFD